MKAYDSGEIILELAKKAAMICYFSIDNPLDVYFEDANVHGRKMNVERKYNAQKRARNGEIMFGFIEEFLDEFEKLNKDDRWLVFKEYQIKSDYLYRKWKSKIVENSSSELAARSYQRYVGEDGHIYLKTDNGVVLKQF